MLSLISALLGSGILVSIFGFAFNLEKRMSKTETRQEGLHELLESQFAEINRRLGRIENCLNGALKGHE